MMWISILLSVSVAKELLHLQKHSHIYNETVPGTQHYEIMINEDKEIFYLDGLGSAIHLFLLHHHITDGTYKTGSHSPCAPVQHGIRFIETQHSHTDVLSQDEEQLSEGKVVTISTMVHIKGGAVVLTSDLSLFVYAFEKIGNHHRPILVEQLSLIGLLIEDIYVDFNNLNQFVEGGKVDIQFGGNSGEMQLAYNGKTKNLYIVFTNKILFAKVEIPKQEVGIKKTQKKAFGEFRSQGRLSFKSIENVLTSYNFLYVATKEEVYIYQSTNDELKLMQVIDKYFLFGTEFKGEFEISDISIGGIDNQLLYVLDRHHGVFLVEHFLFQVDQQDQFTARFLEEIGILRVQQGFKVDHYNDETVIVLSEMPGHLRQHIAVEFNLDTVKGEWFRLNQYSIKGRASDIDVSKRIAVIRGVDAHTVIFHSIWEKFDPTEATSYFYAPHLKNLDFFEEKYGGNDFREWHHNQNHLFLFGVTGHQLILYPWEELNALVRCSTNDLQDVDTTFLYTLYANTTDCYGKTKQGLKIVQDLAICSTEFNFMVKVNGVLIGTPVGKMLAMIFIGVITLVVITLVFCFCRLYRRHQIKRKALETEITGFVSKGYKLDNSSFGLQGNEDL